MSEYRFDFRVTDDQFLKGRTLIDLPFNVWEVFGLKGVIAVKVVINNVEFKLNLVPRGNGNYSFFLTNNMKKKLKLQRGSLLDILISTLNNKVKDGVEICNYEKSNESYLKIDSISYVSEPTSQMCGQACVAMLSGRDVEEVAKVMGTRGSTSIGQIIEALDYYKIRHAEKNIRISKKNPYYSEISILTVHMRNYTHWVLHHKDKFYDPEFGILDKCHPEGKITSFLEIINID
ncbi:DUF1905 domain-containing protein [Clostridium cellulovorans]|uniref:DUF1905 domain-containing protein n=1 Tax=Clostridium cellulovorans (strain ATCC 35296 / DSM 3052 / OCM 3 / 743B) TaxID=573061 RepID=D9SR92_CLOC7|nr:DUF1905 domain-containing protein [Clostridium cellulovorans]ADL52321.1 Domain of unknown function DUF1905 [Clostridium cellulovorans 743B]